MQKVVIDTNILVSALWSQQGNPYKIARMVFTNEIVPYFDSEIIEEYHEVLFRPKLNFPKNKVLSLLNEIVKSGVFSEAVVGDTVFTDESDRKFFDMAKANGAVLITGNTKHYPNESFVLTPHEFLKKKKGVFL
ncbi:MAG: putative toxin-antitoxin system toxin component, PIN family [Oscillospiraceae bacterium]|nr:putative toxin-antitoxin system toxin component, PIN family [Oscillospiraceae bacterium]